LLLNNEWLESRCSKEAEVLMRFLEAWWERVPRVARIAMFGVSVIGMILGGSASGYWQ